MSLRKSQLKIVKKNSFFYHDLKNKTLLIKLKPRDAILVLIVPTIFLVFVFSTYQIFDKWIATQWGWSNIIYKYGHLTDITSNEAKQIVSVASNYTTVPYLIIISFSLLFATNYIKVKPKKLSNYLGNGSLITFIFVIVFMIGMYFLIPLIIKFQDGFNSSSNPIIQKIIIDESVKFSNILIFASPLLFLTNFWLSLFCSQGRALISITIVTISFIVNIMLSFIFVLSTNLGLEGTAYATIIVWFLIFTIAIIFIYYHDDNIKINFRDLKLKKSVILKFFIIGFTVLLEGFSLSILIMMTNRILNLLPPLLIYPNDVTISISLQLYGGIMPWIVVFNFLVIGVIQGARVLFVYIHHIKNYYYFWQVIWRLIILLFSFLTIGLILISVIGKYMMNVFGVQLMMAHDFKKYINIYFIFYPLATFHFSAILFYQGINRSKFALLVSLLRTVLIPSLSLSLGFIFARDTSDDFYFYVLVGAIDLFSSFALVPIVIHGFIKLKLNYKWNYKNELLKI